MREKKTAHKLLVAIMEREKLEDLSINEGTM
jgi:hypothetical protein